MGMLNNPWFRVKVHRITQGDAPCIQFEHPTQAGNQGGGWMVRMKGHPSLTAPAVAVDKAISAPPAAAEPKVTRSQLPASGKKANYSMEEVRKHNTAESTWFVVKGRVYDATAFLKIHPGGSDSIVLSAGQDATEEFEAIHSKKAWDQLEEYYIGDLTSDDDATSVSSRDDTSDSSTHGPLIALDPRNRIPFKMVQKTKLSPDSYRLRFELQSPHHILGLPVGQHMLFSKRVDGKLVMRAYTPITSDHEIGYFDLVIKVYYPTPEYPEGGKMSQILGALEEGDTVDVKGPMGHVTYTSAGVIRLHDQPYQVKSFTMLCAGTGITPIFQILRAVLRNAHDSSTLFVVYGNRNEDDILLRSELNELAAAHPKQLRLTFTLTNPPAGWTGEKGRVNAEMIRRLCPAGADGNFALLCGPKPFEDSCIQALNNYGYDAKHCVTF